MLDRGTQEISSATHTLIVDAQKASSWLKLETLSEGFGLLLVTSGLTAVIQNNVWT